MSLKVPRGGARRPPGTTTFLLLLAFVLAGCTHDPTGERLGNLPPQVRLTGGPLYGEREIYQTRLYWSGWDDDGAVVRYEYAADPPDVFSRDEIAAPETFPDISIRRFTGPRANADTLRVSKVVDGVTWSFDFVQTTDTDLTFGFTTTTPDSHYVGSRLLPLDTSSDYHSFYVRALDNEGAYSDIDRLAFTAWSYAPVSYISYPDITRREYLIVGGEIRIAWGGFDKDGPNGYDPPPGYFWKLVNLRELARPTTVLKAIDPGDIIFKQTASIPWTYQSAETTSVSLLVNPGDYLFAVRAVDPLGAVEPFIDYLRPDTPGNSFRFISTAGGGIPTLTLNEGTLGTFTFTSGVAHYDVEIAVGVPLEFTWSASAAYYGGQIAAFSYGLDVADVESEGPGSGWSPWGRQSRPPESIVFRKPGLHTFYIRVRDEAGNTRVGSLLLDVFSTPLDRPLLIVDDYRNTTNPLDTNHDAFWERIVSASGRVPVQYMDRKYLWYDTGGDRDKYYINNKPPSLSVLGRYGVVIWLVDGIGWCGNTSFVQAASMQPLLRNYLAVGGKLWVLGPTSLAASRRAVYDCNDPEQPFHDPRAPILPRGELEYPLAFAPGEFAWDVLHIASTEVRSDKGSTWEHGLEGVKPWNPADPVLPAMTADPGKYSALFWKYHAVEYCEAIFEPIYVETAFENPGVLDSLYAYVAAVENRPPKNSKLTHSVYSGKLCATRWHDPDPERSQGRVMWFGFPLYSMFDDQALETFNRAIDWFREEVPNNPTP